MRVEALLSGLILTYNHEKYLSSCIKSLLSVDYANTEVCLLDDGSTDRTLAIAQAFVDTAEHPMRVKTQVQSGGRTSENTQKLVEMRAGLGILHRTLSGVSA
jgi:glycosyltransferase involved in cell wall biosynthesis